MSTYIIAEAGVNHNGSLSRARDLVDVAHSAGADAVKFQSFSAEKVSASGAPKAPYQTGSVGDEISQHELLRSLELDRRAHRELRQHCDHRGIDFLSTPFDRESATFLVEDVGVSCVKIGSGEITNGPLLLHVARLGRPVILSTGMSTLAEVTRALSVLAFGYITPPGEGPETEAFEQARRSAEGRRVLEENVVLLHCTTEYPAPIQEVNLRAMDTLGEEFGLPVGLSDHSEGITVPIAAVARGAEVVEKHFTLDRELSGPDHHASLEPDELSAMVTGIREVEHALGSPEKGPTPSEEENLDAIRRSLVAARLIEAGEAFTEENVTVKRPGSGLSPMRYWEILGETADRDYAPDELLA